MWAHCDMKIQIPHFLLLTPNSTLFAIDPNSNSTLFAIDPHFAPGRAVAGLASEQGLSARGY